MGPRFAHTSEPVRLTSSRSLGLNGDWTVLQTNLHDAAPSTSTRPRTTSVTPAQLLRQPLSHCKGSGLSYPRTRADSDVISTPSLAHCGLPSVLGPESPCFPGTFSPPQATFLPKSTQLPAPIETPWRRLSLPVLEMEAQLPSGDQFFSVEGLSTYSEGDFPGSHPPSPFDSVQEYSALLGLSSQMHLPLSALGLGEIVGLPSPLEAPESWSNFENGASTLPLPASSSGSPSARAYDNGSAQKRKRGRPRAAPSICPQCNHVFRRRNDMVRHLR